MRQVKDRSTLILRTAYCVLRQCKYALLVILLLVTACQANNDSNASNRFSGVLEGTKVNVVAEIGGRIANIAVDEGEAVTLGQPIVTLDEAALQAQVKQARAGLSAAEANLAQV